MPSAYVGLDVCSLQVFDAQCQALGVSLEFGDVDQVGVRTDIPARSLCNHTSIRLCRNGSC